jgi:predicted kinase
MKDQKTLILTVGLPRSGKSTWAKKMGYVMVNPDAVRKVLHGREFISESETMVWAITHYMVRALFEAGHNTVVLDATNTTRKRRDPWKSPDWVRKYQVFGVSAMECIGRAKRTQRSDLIPIIEGMAGKYEPVEEEEKQDAEDADTREG